VKKERIIERISEKVRKELENEGSGHDWWHVCRVWKMAKRIAKGESASEAVKE